MSSYFVDTTLETLRARAEFAYSIFKELLAKTFEHLTGEERLRVLRKYVQAAAWACACCWLTSEEMAMEQAWAICSKLMR